jgi:hypothetical protein
VLGIQRRERVSVNRRSSICNDKLNILVSRYSPPFGMICEREVSRLSSKDSQGSFDTRMILSIAPLRDFFHS